MVVVVKQDSAIDTSTGFINTTVEFFRSNWKFMLIGAIVVVLFVIIWYLLKKIEEERHEREEPGYQLFKTVKSSCRLNSKEELINKKWNPKSLFLIFTVVGIFVIPFIKKDHSARIVDYNGRMMGYYRGEYKGMDDTINYLVYKEKKFIFFEDLFVIKVPLKLRMKVKKREKNGNVALDNKKMHVLIDKAVNLNDMVKFLPNKDIKIYCVSLERIGLYYYCPVFLMDKGEGVLDYRQIVEGAVIDNTYQIMVQRLLNTASQAMEKGMLLNPNLKYDQMAPEKTKEEQKIDDGSN